MVELTGCRPEVGSPYITYYMLWNLALSIYNNMTILPYSELLNCPIFLVLMLNWFYFAAMWGRDRRNNRNCHWKYWRHLYMHFHWNFLCFDFSCSWVLLFQRKRPKHKQSWRYVAKEKILKMKSWAFKYLIIFIVSFIFVLSGYPHVLYYQWSIIIMINMYRNKLSLLVLLKFNLLFTFHSYW